MRDAAADLDFEKAARLRDEIKRLKAAELAVMDDPMAREEARDQERSGRSQPSRGGKAARPAISPPVEEMGGSPEGGNLALTSLFAKPTLDDIGPGTDTNPSLFRKPDLDEMGRDIAEPAKKTLFRRNDLDEMTVGRTEKPVTGALPEKPETVKSTKRFSPLEGQPERDDPRPLVRGKAGVGSYEHAGDVKRKSRTKGKTGRPGR
jgi:excinuclease ABC subunit B